LCSNTAPKDWYYVLPQDRDRELGPLKRRITEIRHFVARGFYILQDWDGNDISDQIECTCPPTEPPSPSDAVFTVPDVASPDNQVGVPGPGPNTAAAVAAANEDQLLTDNLVDLDLTTDPLMFTPPCSLTFP